LYATFPISWTIDIKENDEVIIQYFKILGKSEDNLFTSGKNYIDITSTSTSSVEETTNLLAIFTNCCST